MKQPDGCPFRSSGLLVLLGACCWMTVGVTGDAPHAINLPLIFENASEGDVEVYWRNEINHIYNLMAMVRRGEIGRFNTDPGHMFLVTKAGSQPDFFKDLPSHVVKDSEQTVRVTGGKGEGELVVTPIRKLSSAEINSEGSSSSSHHASTMPPNTNIYPLVRNVGQEGVTIHWRYKGTTIYHSLADLPSGLEIKLNSVSDHEFLIWPQGGKPDPGEDANYKPQAPQEQVYVSVARLSRGGVDVLVQVTREGPPDKAKDSMNSSSSKTKAAMHSGPKDHRKSMSQRLQERLQQQ